MTTTRALPGIRFETDPAAVPETLPRMDIAAFVGFASRGPLHTPVSIEDVAQFRDLFGSDAVLARAPDDSERRAYLGPAIEGFFANGGRRCWVVRVAADTAARSTFEVPGLAQMEADGSLTAITAAARCAGSWSDDLAVSTVQRRTRLRVTTLEVVGSPYVYALGLRGSAGALQPGDILDVFIPGEGFGLLLVVDSVRATETGVTVYGDTGQWFEVLPDTGSPPEEDGPTARRVLTPAQGEQRLALLIDPAVLGILIRFDILVWRNDELEARLNDLAFSREHPRFWAVLPDDEALFGQKDGRAYRPPPTQSLLAEITGPRFPLSGPVDPYADSAPQFLPWNMPTVANPGQARAAIRPPGTPLERDGLSLLLAAYFLDDHDINRATMFSVLGEAEHKYYRRQEALRGIYSLLPVREVTVISAPDAQNLVQTVAPTVPDEPLVAPILAPVDGPDPFERYRLQWSSVVGATGYVLEQSSTPDFQRAQSIFSGDDTMRRLLLEPGCPVAVYFRVRADRYGLTGPWSNTRVRVLPPQNFSTCGAIDPETLEILLDEPVAGASQTLNLSWSLVMPEHDGSVDYELEVATDTAFANIVETITTTDTSAIIESPDAGIRYYRVRALHSSQVGPCSNTKVWLSFTFSTSVPDNLSIDIDVAPQMLAVQCALMRWCAARRDVMAILTLPARVTLSQARDHLYVLAPFLFGERDDTSLAELAANVVPLLPGESEALAFAAFYYPWVLRTRNSNVTGGTIQLQPAPPDGSVCGTYASTALEQGAWVAPANTALAGALAVRPDLDLGEWRGYRDAQVNVIRRERGIFVAMDATTLGTSEATRPVNIRRLLMLLRRLALREGQNEVFQPSSIDFRNRVRHRFERLMLDMYQRGAFIGSTPAEAFRVVADESVNPPQSVDAGRFIIELHIAPSRPLEFVTVRLVQTGPEQLLLEDA